MPLSQSDPKLDYDGSWGDASVGWPSISFPSEEEARRAYVSAWRDAKVPYGSYVLVDKELRLETEELKAQVEAVLSDDERMRLLVSVAQVYPALANVHTELLALRRVADAAAAFIDAGGATKDARKHPWADLQHALAESGR